MPPESYLLWDNYAGNGRETWTFESNFQVFATYTKYKGRGSRPSLRQKSEVNSYIQDP